MRIIKLLAVVFITIFLSLTCSSISLAQPYGKGIYNSDIPYGNQTSLTISTDGNVSISITPTTNGTTATGTSSVTVTSTDIMGYKLYIRGLDSTNMNNLGDLLPASLNSFPATLATNTWGYNLDASGNFTGIKLTDTLIHSISTPAKNSDITNITYGAKIDLAKPAGNYTTTIVYTAVPQTN